jgi:hypothetical protein
MLLTASEIRATGSIAVDYGALWEDVQLIAERVHASKDEDRAWAWHHLLLAVANFKTQATLFPPALPAPAAPIHRKKALKVMLASGPLKLRAEDPSTWRALSSEMKGLREPRATTVLSALWPDHHVIMDWKALSAAVALAGARLGWDKSLADPVETNPAQRSWESYDWYRKTVLKAARQAPCRPVEVERALYKLGRESPGITWAAYAAQIEEQITGLSGS